MPTLKCLINAWYYNSHYCRYRFSSSVSANDKHWHHLAISWDEHGGYLRIFKDGHLVQSHHHIRPGSHINSGGQFTIGELHGSSKFHNRPGMLFD